MIRVLVPSFRDDKITQLLRNMEQRERGSTEAVTVLDNGLSPDIFREWPHVSRITVPSDPFVFSQAFNMGVAASKPDDDIVSICDDAEILTEEWYSLLVWRFRHWPPDYGLLTFAEETTSSVYGKHPSAQDIIDLPDVALGPGIAIPRGVLDHIGPWDESLIGYGFDDFDYGVRLYHAGYELGITGAVLLRNREQASAWVKRLGSYEAVVDKTNVNYEIFHRRWFGVVPPQPYMIHRPEKEQHYERRGCTCLP